MSLKDLERFIRRRFIGAHEKPFTGEYVTTPRKALDLAPDAKILVLRQDRIGDTLVSVPVVRALRKHHPEARIHILLSKNNYGVRHAVAPWVDHAWRYDKTPRDAARLLRAFRRERYDVIVDLMDNPSATSSGTVRWAGSRYSVGIMKQNASVYTHCVPLLDRASVHIVERIAQLLLPFGIDPTQEPLDLEYRVTAEDQARARTRLRPTDKPLRLGINVSGSSIYKYWGRENFTRFARWVQARYPSLDVTVCGAPDYAADVAAIVAASGAGGVGPLASFHEFASVIHEFDILVTPDTSILHLAAAWKTPTLTFFHHWEPEVMPWYPYRTPHRALFHRETVGKIPFEDVQRAFEELMEERTGSR
ncbi:MAG: glycosyltransferase family 9 protein [Gemmatimonadota bacterium]